MNYKEIIPLTGGKIYFKVPDVPPGKYYLSAYYPTNNKYQGSYIEHPIYIDQSAATGVMDTTTKTYYNGDYITPMAHFQKEGNPLANAEVEFRLDQQKIGTYFTDTNGMAIGTPYEIITTPGEHKLQAVLKDGSDYAGTTITQTINTIKSQTDLNITIRNRMHVYKQSIYIGDVVEVNCKLDIDPFIQDEETSVELTHNKIFRNGDTDQLTITQTILPESNQTTFNFEFPVLPEEKLGYSYITIKVNDTIYHHSCEESESFIIKAKPTIEIVPKITIGNEYYLFEGNIIDNRGDPFYPPYGEIITYITGVESPYENPTFNVNIDGTYYMPWLYDLDPITHEIKFSLINQDGQLYDFTNFKTKDDNENWITEEGTKFWPGGINTRGPEIFTVGEEGNTEFYESGAMEYSPMDPPGATRTDPVPYIKYFVIEEPYDWEHTTELELILVLNDETEINTRWPLLQMTNEIPNLEKGGEPTRIPINPDGTFTYLMRPQPRLGQNQTRVWELPESKFNDETTNSTQITYIHNNSFQYTPPEKVYVTETKTYFRLPITLTDNYGVPLSNRTITLQDGETILDTKTTNSYGKATFETEVIQYNGKQGFTIKHTDPETDETITSEFHIYIVHEYYAAIIEAETSMGQYDNPELRILLHIENAQHINQHQLTTTDSTGQQITLAQNFVQFTEETTITTENNQEITDTRNILEQNYTFNLPSTLMNQETLQLRFEADEYLGETEAYKAITLVKDTPMIQATQIQNSTLDTETITTNTAHQITADNQDHTITFFITNKTTNEAVNEGVLTITPTLIETLGTLRTTLTLTANPTTLANNQYTTLQVQLQDQYGEPLQGYGVEIYQEATLLGTITTNSNGIASRNTLVSTTNTSMLFSAKFLGDYIYDGSENTTLVTVEKPSATDPMADIFTLTNWKIYSSTPSSTNTGTTATTSQLTSSSINQTVTDKTTQYNVYNKTLQDFWDYYGDEFSLIEYKTGGDGKFELGFINKNNGAKLGYVDGKAVNEANNVSLSAGEVKYQVYNEITFTKVGTDLHLFWRIQGSTYTEKTVALGNIDPTKYYFYMKSTVRSGLTLTTDTTQIQNKSKS